jgi:hypothetical protein
MGKFLGVVYATGSKMIRRMIISDDDTNLDNRHAGPGESFHLVAKVPGWIHLNTAKLAIRNLTGVDPPSTRCAVLDNNSRVESLIDADPDLDMLPNKTLVSAPPTVEVGHLYDPILKTFSVSGA